MGKSRRERREKKFAQANSKLPQATALPSRSVLPSLSAGDSTGVDKRIQGPAKPDASLATDQPISPSDNEQFLRAVSFDVVDKQYRLYAWSDAKNQALITTNGLLFAAVGFLYKESLKDTLAIILLVLGVVLIAASLIMCLTQVLPKIASGKSGNEPNTRSLRGISTYETWEKYRDAFICTTKSSILMDTIRQIYGMASNNMRSSRIIKKGVYLTSGGALMILLTIWVNAIAARGTHLLGSWQVEVVQAVGSTNTIQLSPPQSIMTVSDPATAIPVLPAPSALVLPANSTNNLSRGTNP